MQSLEVLYYLNYKIWGSYMEGILINTFDEEESFSYREVREKRGCFHPHDCQLLHRRVDECRYEHLWAWLLSSTRCSYILHTPLPFKQYTKILGVYLRGRAFDCKQYTKIQNKKYKTKLSLSTVLGQNRNSSLLTIFALIIVQFSTLPSSQL